MITIKKQSKCLLLLLLMACSDQESIENDQKAVVAFNGDKDQEVIVSIEGDLERGRKLYLQCQACHSLKAGEPHKIGPNLFKLIGSKVGSKEGYNYSDALLKTDIFWTLENLDFWLEKPYEIAPGNKMVFSGIRNEKDRKDLIAYIYVQTSERKNQE